MLNRYILCQHLEAFRENLIREEKSAATIEKYLRDARAFVDFAGEREVTKELTKEEYFRLLDDSKSQTRLNLVIQTICGTGIRVSELKYFTVESVKRGEICVQCKSVRCSR